MTDILGEAMSNHLTAALVRSAAMAGITNPKNAARRLRDAGVDLAPEHLLKAVELNRQRLNRHAIGNDPLVLGAFHRKTRLEEFKRLKRVLASAMYRSWRKDFRERVENAARYLPWKIDSEAQKATMEAIVRACRSRGWQTRHTSQHNGRASSRYIIIPGVGECRLSDHEIPMTPEREWRASEGRRQSWNGEVVIGDDWRTVRLDAWLRRILLAAAGR